MAIQTAGCDPQQVHLGSKASGDATMLTASLVKSRVEVMVPRSTRHRPSKAICVPPSSRNRQYIHLGEYQEFR